MVFGLVVTDGGRVGVVANLGPRFGGKHDGILREGEMRSVKCKGVVPPVGCPLRVRADKMG